MPHEIVLRLRDFVASRDDPRTLVLDARTQSERVSTDLSNPFVTVVWAPHATLAKNVHRMAALLGSRHVVVVDATENDAAEAVRILRDCDVSAMALEGGIAGWRLLSERNFDAAVESV